MLKKCKGCKHHRNDNGAMRVQGNKTIVGNFCLKFAWNLDRVKTWVQKKEQVKTIVKLPMMYKVPEDCFE